MLQLSANPALSWSRHGGEQLTEDDWRQPWFVAYTRPRQEKALAHDLRRLEVTYFCPLVMRVTSSGGRRRRNMYPLFSSYLFFAGDEAARQACLRTDRLVQVIEPLPAEQSRLRAELSSLLAVLQNAPNRVELNRHLQPGVRARIKAGPLRGVEGTVIESERACKLQLAVSLLGVGAVVEIHADLVERL
jgi:transcription antitermination factor NusG